MAVAQRTAAKPVPHSWLAAGALAINLLRNSHKSMSRNVLLSFRRLFLHRQYLCASLMKSLSVLATQRRGLSAHIERVEIRVASQTIILFRTALLAQHRIRARSHNTFLFCMFDEISQPRGLFFRPLSPKHKTQLFLFSTAQLRQSLA